MTNINERTERIIQRRTETAFPDPYFIRMEVENGRGKPVRASRMALHTPCNRNSSNGWLLSNGVDGERLAMLSFLSLFLFLFGDPQ